MGQPCGQRFDPLCRGQRHGFSIGPVDGQTGGNTCFDVKEPFLIHAFDLGQFCDRFARDEIGQRDQTFGCAHLERIQGGQHPVFFGQAHANFDFFVGSVHAH